MVPYRTQSKLVAFPDVKGQSLYLLRLRIEVFSWAQLDKVEIVPQGALHFRIENLENRVPLDRVLHHLPDLNLFDWFYYNVIFMLDFILDELGCEIGCLFQVLESPNHSTTLYHILYFLFKLSMDLFVDQLVNKRTVLGNLGFSVNGKLVHNVVLLVELDIVQVCEECTSLSIFEFSY